jgi:predicted Zn finger-like uncharacterized protein
MDVTCSHCNTEYEFDDALVSEAGTSVRCTQCGHRFKVRRPDGSGAPEVWIVRTVDGQTLEFRALRELKTAISARKIGRDDVLSRGAGRPRRLTSIAELEPFFAALEPKPKPKEDGPRPRAHTPSGLGPSNPRGSYFDLAAFAPRRDGGPPSVNVPPPTPSGSSRETNPFLDEDEVTRSRQFTRELHQLGDQAPASIEPRTEPDPKRFPDSGPATVLGVQAAAEPVSPALAVPKAPDSLATTLLFGTPNDAAKGDHLPSFEEPTQGDRRQPTLIGLEAESKRGLELAAAAERERAEVAAKAAGAEAAADGAAAVRRSEPRKALKSDPLPPPPPPGPIYAGAAATPKTSPLPSKSAPPAVRTPSAPPPPARLPPPKPPPRHEAKSEPELEAPSARPNVLPPSPEVERVAKTQEPTPAPESATEEGPRSVGARGKGRSSASTVTPPSEVRYSIADDSADSRRVSSMASRRSSSSMRLIVGLLVGGALVFAGVVLFNKYVSKPEDAAAAKAPDASGLLAECERALAEGDLATASERAADARKVAESDPRVAKLSAKVAIAKAEIAWLELLILPRDDAGRPVTFRRYQAEVGEATSLTDRAALLAPGDPEVARLVMDQKRLVGDVGAATRLRASLEPIGGEPETDLALGAVEMLSADVSSWTGILDRLERATAGEKQAGRARALFVYALVRARDAKRARAQLDELAKLKRPHPVEAALRRFVERVEKGDKIAFRLADLPSPDAKTPSVDVAGPLKAAEDALAKRDTKKAEALFQQVLSADEHNPDALVGLAQIAKQNGNGKQAAALLERAVDKNPDHARALLALADARWDASDSPGAKSLYKRALDAGLTGAGADRAKQRTAATSATGTAEPTPTATIDPTPTATTPPTTTGGGVEPPPFGQDPPPFGQDPPPPPPPKPPDTSQPPGAPL